MSGKRLIEIARRAIEGYFLNEEFKINEFNERRGVFVSLYIGEGLRGCIGLVNPVDLNKGIVEAARAAAFSDPRFMALRKEELRDLRIEVTLLSEVELVRNYFKEIKIGRDGLVIEKEDKKGLLLPQVFVEYNVDVKGALEMVCEKAGLNKNSWQEEDAKIYKFKADAYAEKSAKGEVIKKI